jgi:hypothetical protein
MTIKKTKIGQVTTKPFYKLLPDVGNNPKGDLGEYAVDLCLRSLGLEEPKDFKHYPRSQRGRKGEKGDYHPDFSNEKTFGIEVKNLSFTTQIKPAWIDDSIKSRFSGKFEHLPVKIAIIFGGDIDPRAIGRMRELDITPILYPNPIDLKDYGKVRWWLKDELLGIDPIRMMMTCKHGYHKPRIFPLRVISKDNKPFFEIHTDQEENRTVVTTFSEDGKPASQWRDPVLRTW